MTDNFKSLTEKATDYILKNLILEMKKEGFLKLTFTVPEAARVLGINKIKMYEIAKTEDFPSIVLGNRILIPVIPLLEWIEKVAWNKAS